jgi:hypothetical protein
MYHDRHPLSLIVMHLKDSRIVGARTNVSIPFEYPSLATGSHTGNMDQQLAELYSK